MNLLLNQPIKYGLYWELVMFLFCRFGSFAFAGGKNIVDSVTASLSRENEIEEVRKKSIIDFFNIKNIFSRFHFNEIKLL